MASASVNSLRANLYLKRASLNKRFTRLVAQSSLGVDSDQFKLVSMRNIGVIPKFYLRSSFSHYIIVRPPQACIDRIPL